MTWSYLGKYNNSFDSSSEVTMLLVSICLFIRRELIDAECYEYAAEFLCSVLQPKCIQRPSLPTDETKLPCRAFCREFWAGCGDRLTDNLKKSLDCFKFPEYSDFGRKCRAQPSKSNRNMFLMKDRIFLPVHWNRNGIHVVAFLYLTEKIIRKFHQHAWISSILWFLSIEYGFWIQCPNSKFLIDRTIFVEP